MGFENRIRFSKHTYGFQNTHTVFNEMRLLIKNQMCVLKTKFGFQNTNVVLITHFKFGIFFANSVNFEIIIKTQIWFSKHTFGFQKPYLVFEIQIQKTIFQ